MGCMGRLALKAELRKLILGEGYLLHGDFVLSSGLHSNYYLNSKELFLHPEGARLFCQWVLYCIDELPKEPVAVGGLASSAEIIAGAVMAMSGFHYSSFVVNTLNSTIEGRVPINSSVVLIDEVVVTGDRLLKAINAITCNKCHVDQVFCLMDHEPSHAPQVQRYLPLIKSMFTIKDFDDGIGPYSI
jgi:orotate phosphoribosyltransferase